MRSVRRFARALPVVLAACSPGSHARLAPIFSAQARADTGWRYEAAVGPATRELAITIHIPQGPAIALEVASSAGRFVRDVACSTGDRYELILPTESSAASSPIWRLPACPAHGCRVRYRFDLANAAHAFADDGIAAAHGEAIVAPLSVWLLHPTDPRDGEPFRLRVVTPPGIAFASGVPAIDGVPGEYTADLSDLPNAPLSAFGPMRTHPLDIAGQRIEIAILAGPLAITDEVLDRWVASSAELVRGYHARAPIARTLLVIAPSEGHGIGYARVFGNGGASIIAPLGRETTETELLASAELIHELLHVAFPNLAREHLWFTEGVATYVEPILRARGGQITPETAFGRLHRRMSFGLPRADEGGLDETPTWARTYWGGALFCLLADVEIRARTGNRRSLDDALRAITAAGGNVAARWDLAHTLEVGDAATGVAVLGELYGKMGRAPMAVDLDALWAKLGVRVAGESVAFDESAPLAAVRRAIVSRSKDP